MRLLPLGMLFGGIPEKFFEIVHTLRKLLVQVSACFEFFLKFSLISSCCDMLRRGILEQILDTLNPLVQCGLCYIAFSMSLLPHRMLGGRISEHRLDMLNSSPE